MKYIKIFKEINKESAALVGGKGASLGEMLNTGFPIPNGFVLKSTAFIEFLKQLNASQTIKEILSKVDYNNEKQIDDASNKIQKIIIDAVIPDDIQKEIIRVFDNLGFERVAVRSSATSEDGAEHSWAGQFESYLNVTKKDLLHKIKECFASFYTPRSVFYRYQNDLLNQNNSIAVVVQEMVQSEISGVAFSVHPVLNDKNQIVIEAVKGLGDNIVSGRVTPDTYIIQKQSLEINSKQLRQKKALLDDAQITELAGMISNIENHYGFPVDVEWAMEKGKFYITQSRPITTLKSNDYMELTNKIRAMEWYPILERPCPPFVMSTFEECNRKEAFRDIGLAGISPIPQALQNSIYYLENKSVEVARQEIAEYFKNHTMQDITNTLNRFFQQSKEDIKQINIDTNIGNIEKNFERFYAIITKICSFVSITNPITHYINKQLEVEVPKYIKGDVQKFIEEASLPIKQNAHFYFNEALLSDIPSSEILKKYGWIKTREGLEPLFTIEEIDEMRRNTKPYKHIGSDVVVPGELQRLFDDVRELVWFRVERGDIRRQLMVLARPFLNRVAQKHNITFEQLANCRAKSFIYGKVEMYDTEPTFVFDGENVIFQKGPILIEKTTEHADVVGAVAFAGKVTGVAKIVKSVGDLSKVENGDIMVAVMTFPSYIQAMNRASAFVTDEGGITCHAAIVAREMQKPCIIGTKNATKIIKDGDKIEVDAISGVVRFIK